MARKRAPDALDAPKILLGGGVVLGAIALSLLGAWGLLRAFGGDVRALPVARAAFPSPVLESHPGEDFAAYQQRERARLASYGWADRRAGQVRIPIEIAMERLNRKHLTGREAPPQPSPPQ